MLIPNGIANHSINFAAKDVEIYQEVPGKIQLKKKYGKH
jgi:hypothetical protein